MLNEVGKNAKAAARVLAAATTEEKNSALIKIAEALEAGCADILKANAVDMDAGRAKGMTLNIIRAVSKIAIHRENPISIPVFLKDESGTQLTQNHWVFGTEVYTNTQSRPRLSL